jgi:hypothetical protein
MTKEDLIKSAGMLKQPSHEAGKEYGTKKEILAAEMNKLMASRKDISVLIGENNIKMMEDNHRNHVRFMSSVFLHYNPEVLVDTVLWVFRAYRSHGFHLTYWPAQLDQWVEIFKTQLSAETYKEIYPFYDWMIVNQPAFVSESDKLIMNSETPKHGG